MSYLIVAENVTTKFEVHLHQRFSATVNILGMEFLNPRFEVFDHVLRHEIGGSTGFLVCDGNNLLLSRLDVLEGCNHLVVISVEDEGVLRWLFGGLNGRGG